MTYIYLKKTTKRFPKLSQINKKYIAIIFFSLGAFLLFSAVLPIIRYQLEYAVKFNQVINPLSVKFYNRSSSILGDVSSDYTQISNWFVENPNPENSSFLSPDRASSYYLSIPELKINNAVVEVGNMDLKKSLIQYPQTALPGQYGNTVILGHSVLPQFFNPKSYLTIFSTLYRLETGAEIFIDYDSIQYKYVVDEMFEVQPSDLSVLEQTFDNRVLTLITCSPPGTYLRRLIIKAKISDNI